MRPYTDHVKNEDFIIREFDQNIDPIELMWHRDKEDRIVEALEPTDWMVQLDNEIPNKLVKPIFIPKLVWHKVIKGTQNLKIKINTFR